MKTAKKVQKVLTSICKKLFFIFTKIRPFDKSVQLQRKNKQKSTDTFSD